MLNFGNKEFRNLQEQVLKNAQDIETLKGREDLQIVIVNELPEVGNPNYIYLVAKDDGEQPDIYDEYIWLEDEERYEKIGGVSIDLTHYVTLDTEQTISSSKTLASPLYFNTGAENETTWSIQKQTNQLDIYQGSNRNYILQGGAFLPVNTNGVDLGSSSRNWKDMYLSGRLYGSQTISISYNNQTYLFQKQGNDAIVIQNSASARGIRVSGASGALEPTTTNVWSLGSSSYFWTNLHLTGYITDGANTVSVANIASKATSTFISGTFDANGESTIDTEQAGTPEGLFIFTYGNCQSFLRLTATMVNSADVTPIRVSIPMIYNSDTVNGWLNITKSGYILILKITDGTNHVDSGYVWTLTKTNLI
jgi:hypothetical protein